MNTCRTLPLLAVLAIAATAIAAGTAGTLDTGFGGDGVVVTQSSPNGALYALAVQSDGKVVAVGHDGAVDGVSEWAIRRYLANGALDTTFGSGGEVRLFGDVGADSAMDVAIDGSGRIVVVGDAVVSSKGKGKKVTYDHVLTVVRLASGGSLDTSFGNGGVAHVNLPDSDREDARAVAIRPDGRIVVGGTAQATTTGSSGGKGKGGKTQTTSSSALAIVQLLSGGSLDTGFGGGDGHLVHDLGTGDEFLIVGAMGLQSDGSIVLGSREFSGSSWTITRYTAGGSIDTAFGTVLGTSGRQLNALAVQSDDKIVASGYDIAGDTDAVVVRYLAQGGIDTAFATSGVFHSGLSGRDEAGPVALQPDGKIVVGLMDIPSSSEIDLLALRLDADGSLDTDFGTLGFSDNVDVNEQDGSFDVAVAPSGRLVLGGITVGSATDWFGDWLIVAFNGS